MNARREKRPRSRWSMAAAKDIRDAGDPEKMEDTMVKAFRFSYAAYDDWQRE